MRGRRLGGARLAAFFRDDERETSRQVIWEYPRETPQGDQTDLVEVMDIANGRIARHRVYWDWVGFKALAAALDNPAA